MNRKIRVISVMRDGEVRGSVEGVTPPPDCECWQTIRNIEKRLIERSMNHDAFGETGKKIIQV